jgi:hypothetical protein
MENYNISTILMANAFKINNYHLLEAIDESKYIVRNVGNQSSLIPTLEDINIGTRDEIGRENGHLARKSEQFKDKMQNGPC